MAKRPLVTCRKGWIPTPMSPSCSCWTEPVGMVDQRCARSWQQTGGWSCCAFPLPPPTSIHRRWCGRRHAHPSAIIMTILSWLRWPTALNSIWSQPRSVISCWKSTTMAAYAPCSADFSIRLGACRYLPNAVERCRRLVHFGGVPRQIEQCRSSRHQSHCRRRRSNFRFRSGDSCVASILIDLETNSILIINNGGVGVLSKHHRTCARLCQNARQCWDRG